MRMILTAIPESSGELAGVPDDWSLDRHVELHWLPDARHPDVTAEMVVASITCAPDGTRHLHLANADPGECTAPHPPRATPTTRAAVAAGQENPR